ncbi:MAG: phosphate signaling complex protein PhoU [Fimbriimonadaceae bacterium]|jgi:phosphate transport system protein|nr:phosphate signaling complex protein PhoU [Fimbriimonadaceae bacterium]
MENITPGRQLFLNQKEALEREVLEMVSGVDRMMAGAVDALVNLDQQAALDVISQDDAIDRMDIDVEEKCLRLLALQQPMGSDLREIGTIIKMITDIERIGDLAVDLAKIVIKIENELGESSYIDIKRMSIAALDMLGLAVRAFVRKNIDGLDAIIVMEESVDDLYRDFREQVFDYMRRKPDQVVAASWMLLAVHHIERVADHALNIAERVHFMVTGELRQLVPHDSRTS